MPAGGLAIADDRREIAFAVLAEPLTGVEQMLGVKPGLDALGEFDLVGGVEQRGLADAVQVHPHEVGGWALSVQIAVNPAGGGVCHCGLLIARTVMSSNVRSSEEFPPGCHLTPF